MMHYMKTEPVDNLKEFLGPPRSVLVTGGQELSSQHFNIFEKALLIFV